MRIRDPFHLSLTYDPLVLPRDSTPRLLGSVAGRPPRPVVCRSKLAAPKHQRELAPVGNEVLRAALAEAAEDRRIPFAFDGGALARGEGAVPISPRLQLHVDKSSC